MSVAAAALLWLVIGFVLANLPFLTERRFLLITRGEKSFVFRLLELLVGYALTLALGFLLEGSRWSNPGADLEFLRHHPLDVSRACLSRLCLAISKAPVGAPMRTSCP